MSLTPVSREHLRSLKQKIEIDKYVRHIYSSALRQAETTTDTYYQYTRIDESMRKNIPEILHNLKSLFPDCLVEYQNTIEGNDGKMYNINKLDESMCQILLNPSYKTKVQEQIVIEWS